MNIQEQLQELVDDLDEARVNLELCVQTVEREDASLQSALTYMRSLRNLLDEVGRSDKLHALTAALVGSSGASGDAQTDVR